MKKQKMQLSELKVESFKTSEAKEVNGGITPLTVPITITISREISEALC
ncbi:pinensin family lanthipeptide [Roseivirga sp. BDSF3-8]